MNATLVIILSCLVSVIFSGASFARDCWTDLDCSAGNTCIRADYDDGSRGVCTESGEGTQSSQPMFRLKTNTETKKPERNTKGKTCFGDADCDSGQECAIKPGQMYGICR